MKKLNCPHCGKAPTTLGFIGITTTCCLGCTTKVGKHGIPCRNTSQSIKAWNEWVKEQTKIEEAR